VKVNDEKHVCGFDGDAALDYVEERLAPEAAKQFEAHVRVCAACRNELALLSEAHAALKRNPGVFGPTDEELLAAMREVSSEAYRPVMPEELKARLRKEETFELSRIRRKEHEQSAHPGACGRDPRRRARLTFSSLYRRPIFTFRRFVSIPLLAAGTCAAALLLVTVWPSMKRAATDLPGLPSGTAPSYFEERAQRPPQTELHALEANSGRAIPGTHFNPIERKSGKPTESREPADAPARDYSPVSSGTSERAVDVGNRSDAPTALSSEAGPGDKDAHRFGQTHAVPHAPDGRDIPPPLMGVSPKRESHDQPSHSIASRGAVSPRSRERAKGQAETPHFRVLPRLEAPNDATKAFSRRSAGAPEVPDKRPEKVIVALHIVDRREVRIPSFGDNPSTLNCGPYLFRPALPRDTPDNHEAPLRREEKTESARADGRTTRRLTVEITPTERLLTLSAEIDDGHGFRKSAQVHDVRPEDLEVRARELISSVLPYCH
jgi:hypothetical protein